MDRLMPFDELNTLSELTRQIMSLPVPERREYRGLLMDEILDILILSYVFGSEAANDMLGDSIDIDREELTESVNKRIAGKNWIERFDEYFGSETGTADDIIRVADTDSHRIYNEAISDVGEKAEGVILKTWETMLDDKVRDTHAYLERQTIPFESRFYTFDGDSALAPGGFDRPENNVNCRCRIRLTRS